MARDCMTEEQVEMEIERLTHSPYVQLARQEQRAKYRRQQYMYQLRWMEKRGKELEAQGKDADYFDELIGPEGD